MEITCSCGFELSDLPARCPVVATDQGLVPISCPLCGQALEIGVEALGILVRGTGPQTKYLRWKQGKQSPSKLVTVGGATSRFQLDFEALDSIEVGQVLYARIPVFQAEDGKLVVPSLPVRGDYFDCIDQRALARLHAESHHAAHVGGEYHALVPLRGMREPVAVTLPVYAYRDGTGAEQRALRGLNLKVWPNTPIRQWKYYLVGLAVADQGSDAAVVPRVRLSARTELAAEWSAVATSQRSGSVLAGAFEHRPAWIAFELGDVGAEAGGLFFVPPATEDAAGQLDIGLDFGTSNTCVAIRAEDATPSLLRAVPETAWNLYLVRGGPEATVHAGPDLWPSPAGFGSHADLFASELLFPCTRTEQMRRLSSVGSWRYGIEYGIPAAGAAPGFAEAEYSLADFKWVQLLTRTAPTFAQHIEKLQSRYLLAALLDTYVRAAIASKSWPGDIRVVYSYPTSFDLVDKKTLTDAAAAADEALRAATGLAWKLDCGADESTAAATNAGEVGNVRVYLDMGGGSTDIAIKIERGRDDWSPIYLTSVRYAGMTLLAGYEGEGRQHTCLAGNGTLDQLRRRVREAKNVAQVLGDNSLFDRRQESVSKNRTLHFYGYIVEYVARLLAAGFLDQRFQVEGESGLEFPRELKIAMFFLGNGWRFNTWLAADYRAALGRDIWKRTTQLLAAEKSAYATEVQARLKGVRVGHETAELQDVAHEKAAVALGLLRGKTARTADGRPRSILGWTTSVDGRVEVPWYALYDVALNEPPPAPGVVGEDVFVFGGGGESRSELATPWYAEIRPSASIDWKDAPPKLPASLIGPFELDKNLNMTRGRLKQQCSSASSRWFVRSPYEVLLEELLGPKLRTLGA